MLLQETELVKHHMHLWAPWEQRRPAFNIELRTLSYCTERGRPILTNLRSLFGCEPVPCQLQSSSLQQKGRQQEELQTALVQLASIPSEQQVELHARQLGSALQEQKGAQLVELQKLCLEWPLDLFQSSPARFFLF